MEHRCVTSKWRSCQKRREQRVYSWAEKRGKPGLSLLTRRRGCTGTRAKWLASITVGSSQTAGGAVTDEGDTIRAETAEHGRRKKPGRGRGTRARPGETTWQSWGHRLLKVKMRTGGKNVRFGEMIQVWVCIVCLWWSWRRCIYKSCSLCAGRLLIYYEKDQSGGLFMHLRVTEEQQQRRHGQQSYQKIHRCKCGVFCTLPGCRAWPLALYFALRPSGGRSFGHISVTKDLG